MEAFVGTIMPVGFNFAPRGWALCNGQLLNVAQNQVLFGLIGTRFGGDGEKTFGLPDLRGRTPRGASTAGGRRGQETVTLAVTEIPTHIHALVASTAKGAVLRVPAPPVGKFLAADPVETNKIYGTPSGPVTLSGNNVANAGGNQGHDNMQPSLVVNYIIALTGTYPTQP